MKKTFIILESLMLLLGLFSNANGQEILDQYFYKPYPIHQFNGKTILAGDVKTFIYSHSFYKVDKKTKIQNPYANPENLILTLFQDIRIQKLNLIPKLFDSTYHRSESKDQRLLNLGKAYDGIRFIHKFQTGDITYVKYDFTTDKKYNPYFALVRNESKPFYLSQAINLSEPLNLIGSLSPLNFHNKLEANVDTSKMVAFYYVRKEGRWVFTNQFPLVDHTTLFVSFNFIKPAINPFADFIEKVKLAAQSLDSTRLIKMVEKDQIPLLEKKDFKNELSGIRKIFKNYEIIPLASINTAEGRILYFRFYNPQYHIKGLTSMVVSNNLKGPTIKLIIQNQALNNVLTNTYVDESIKDYLGKLL